MPTGLRPMRPVSGQLPADPEEWAFQPAWRGIRVLAASQGGRVELIDADGVDVTARFPELRVLGAALGVTELILDGELVVTGPDGHPDADRLATRARARSDAVARRLSASSPAVLMVGDLVWLEGHSCAELPYWDRRKRLADLNLAGASWLVNPDHPGEGEAMLAAARAQALPGILAKRLDSPYRPDEASPHWVFVAA